MENRAKASSECGLLEQGVLGANKVLLTISEDYIQSGPFVTASNNRKDLSNTQKCQLNETNKNDFNGTQDKHATSTRIQFENNCFFIKELPVDCHFTTKVGQEPKKNTLRPIAPKTESNNTNSRKISFEVDPYRKRDDKRRATHNEIERRRRDKINSWIFKLKELIPESNDSPDGDSKTKANGSDSKSEILIRACDYIKEMQEELKSLRECLMENDNTRISNQQLQLDRDKLKTICTQPTNEVRSETSMGTIKDEPK